MQFAQILSGVVQNIIVLTDSSLESVFSAGYDYFIEVDALSPRPQIGWLYDGANFSEPIVSIPALTATQIQAAEILFGEQLILNFSLSGVINSSLTAAELSATIMVLLPVKIFLELGQFGAAITVIQAITPTAVLTSTILNGFIAQLEGYLTANPGSV